MVEAKHWERGRLKLLLWSEIAKNRTKNIKKGAKIDMRREGRSRETKSIPPPLKSLTKRWKPHKIINILGMISVARYLHFMYTIIICTMLGFCEKLITSKY
jgi:hypothetical protein